MNLRKWVGFTGVVVLILSALPHFLTYWQIDLAEEFWPVWALFAFSIAIFAFLINSSVVKNSPISYKDRLTIMPKWSWVVLSGFFVYLVFLAPTFFRFGIAVPYEDNGKYILNEHGRITEYTLQDVELRKLYRLRLASAFWMYMTLWSTLYLLTAKDGSSDKKD